MNEQLKKAQARAALIARTKRLAAEARAQRLADKLGVIGD